MPNHRKADQARFGAGRSIGQVKHEAHQLPQRHSVGVYPTIPASPIVDAITGVGSALALIILAGAIRSRQWHGKYRKSAETSYTYRRAGSLLTPTEAEFYRTLREAVGPMADIQCKVRLADLLIALEGNRGAFNKVSQKHVDFVLCERGTLRPLVAVELDDPSHQRPDRQARDQFVDSAYRSAGLAIVHIQTQEQYNAAELLTRLNPLLVYVNN